jgi:hypothetical protein
MSEKTGYLSKFSYVNGSLSDLSWDCLLAYIFVNNKNLKELDISYNKVTSNMMYKFLEYLSDNRKLTYVDISHNQVF